MQPTEPRLCVLLLGSATSPESAADLVKISSGCPYAAAYTARGRLVLSAYVLPAAKRWWIEGIEARPELLGLEKIQLVFTDYDDAGSPWSRGEVQPVLETPPCGSNCARCPMYGDRCEGCPAWKGKICG